MENLPGIWSLTQDLWLAEQEDAPGLAARRSARFADLLTHARARSRFYRQLYRHLPVNGVEVGDLPVVTKPDLMAAFDDWVTDPAITRDGIAEFISDPDRIATPYLGEYFISESAGTTGIPGLYVSDPDAIEIYRAISLARIARTWFTATDWLHMTRGGFRWAAVLGTGGHYVGAGWIELERRRDPFRAGAFRVFSALQPLEDLVASLNAFDPAMLTGYPSAIELLAEEQAAGRLALRPALVECGGETLSGQAAAQLQSAFGCPVRNLYSASECITMAFSCAHGWLHVNSDWVILEPVDEDMRATPPGQPSSTVLLTNLANRVQPFIRYDLGDSVVMKPDRCRCGSPLPALHVTGRHDDVLNLKRQCGDVVKILPLAIGTVVEQTPGVHRSQLIQTGPARLRLRLELRSGSQEETTWRDALARLHAYLAGQRLANVELIRACEPPARRGRFGKFRQVIVPPEATCSDLPDGIASAL